MLWTTTNASAPAIAAIPRSSPDAGRMQTESRAGRRLRRLDRLLDPLRVFLTQHYHLPDAPPPLKPPEPLL